MLQAPYGGGVAPPANPLMALLQQLQQRSTQLPGIQPFPGFGGPQPQGGQMTPGVPVDVSHGFKNGAFNPQLQPGPQHGQFPPQQHGQFPHVGFPPHGAPGPQHGQLNTSPEHAPLHPAMVEAIGHIANLLQGLQGGHGKPAGNIRAVPAFLRGAGHHAVVPPTAY